MIFNRTFEKIKHLGALKNTEALKLSQIKKHLRGATLIINTTPGNPLAGLEAKYLELIDNTIGYDVVYRPKETDFLSFFKEKNRIYGIEMLLAQAGPCFFEWYKKKPEIDSALEELLERFLT